MALLSSPTTNRDRVLDVIHEYLDIPLDKIKPESRIIEDLGADSLDLVEMTMALEDEFNMDMIPDEVAEKFLTVQDVTTWIDKQRP